MCELKVGWWLDCLLLLQDAESKVAQEYLTQME